MTEKKDILAGSEDLKKMPFSVPEGYFEGLGAKVRERIGREEEAQGRPERKRVLPARLIPWLAAAAAAAIIVAIGVTLGSSGGKAAVPEDGLQDSDYVFYYTEIIPVTEPEAIYYSYNSDSGSELSYDDIIDYLVDSGVDVNALINDLN